MSDAALALLAAHTLGDFPLQTDFMARRKFDYPLARFYHILVHVFATILLLVPVVSLTTAAVAGWAVGLLHFGIDTRRWVKPKDEFEAYPIAVDQSLHVASLYVVAVVVL